jgi:hypothetical protein
MKDLQSFAARVVLLLSLAVCLGLLSPTLAEAQDALPTGTISYFNLASCPTGWDSLTMANGRFLVPVSPNAGIAATVGDPLASKEDRTHVHPFSSSIDVNSCSYILVGGCCNKDLGASGTRTFSGTTAATSTGLPYVQLLLCMKSAAPPPNPEPIPAGTLIFYSQWMCPPGWSEAITVEGRLPVGLPANGLPGATFGGSALEGREDRPHTHSISGAVPLSSQQIAGGSGCCADGYSSNGTYPYNGTTGGVSSGLPYIQFLMCQKN